MSIAWWYPAARQGLLIEDARTWRVRLADGAVEVHRDGGHVETLARPGEVGRVVVLSSAQAGSLTPDHYGEVVAVLRDGQPLLAVPVADISSGTAASESQARAEAGLADGAAALGLAVEAATDDEARIVRSSHLQTGDAVSSSRRDQHAQTAMLVVAAVGIAVMIVAGPYAATWRPAALVAAVMLLAVASWRVLLRRRLRALWAEPAAHGRVSVPRSEDRRSGGRAFLQVGRDEIVLGLLESEHWVAGPDRGGVTQCSVVPAGLVLADHRGEVRLAAPDLWVRRDLEDVCALAGIAFGARPGTYAPAAADSVTHLSRAKAKDGVWPYMDGVHTGDASRIATVAAPVLAFVVALFSLADPDAGLDAATTPSGILSLVALGLFGWLDVDRRRQQRLLSA